MKHDIFTIEANKVALNRNDDKRISKKKGFSTLATWAPRHEAPRKRRAHKSLSWSPIFGELFL